MDVKLLTAYFWSNSPENVRDAATWWRSCNLSTFTLWGGDTKARGGWEGGGGDAVRSSSGGGEGTQSEDAHGEGWWRSWPITVPVAHKAPCTCIGSRSTITRCAGAKAALPTHAQSTAVPRGPCLWHFLTMEWLTHNIVQVGGSATGSNPGN